MTNKPLSEMTPKEKVEAGIQKAQKSKPMTIEELSKSDKDLIEKCLLTRKEERDAFVEYDRLCVEENYTASLESFLREKLLAKAIPIIRKEYEQEIRELRIEVGSVAFEKGKKCIEQKRLDRPDKKVCKCPACPNGSVYLIKLGEFDYKFQCDNDKCQTRRRRWSDG